MSEQLDVLPELAETVGEAVGEPALDPDLQEMLDNTQFVLKSELDEAKQVIKSLQKQALHLQTTVDRTDKIRVKKAGMLKSCMKVNERFCESFVKKE